MKHQLLMLCLVILAAVGLFGGYPLILAVAAFVSALWVLSWTYGQRALGALRVRHRLSHAAVMPGQSTDVALVIENPLNWPLPLVEWWDELPEAVEPQEDWGRHRSRAPVGHRYLLDGHFNLNRRERVVRHLPVVARRRGRHLLGPIHVGIRDPLGLMDFREQISPDLALTVFPTLYALPPGLVSPTRPQGERRGPPWNPPDPSRVVGVRPYVAGDSPRLIHPYATARTGTLQVKRLDPEGDDQLELIVLAGTARFIWEGIDSPRLEALISAVASVADYHLLRQDVAVGLTLAGAVYGSPRGLSLPPRRGRDQWAKVLTALAWVQPGGGEAGELTAGLMRLRSRITPQSRVMLFSCFYDEAWTPYLLALCQRRIAVTWVPVGMRELPPPLAGIVVRPWTPGGLADA